MCEKTTIVRLDLIILTLAVNIRENQGWNNLFSIKTHFEIEY